MNSGPFNNIRNDRSNRLLGATDPAPVKWVNGDSEAPILLLCEHAGNKLPGSLDPQDLPIKALNSHIGWDIGAAALARKLAGVLQAPLIMQRYSRLIIDCNRPPGSKGSIPQISDGITIPMNIQLNDEEIMRRQTEIFDPLDKAIQQGLDRFPRKAVFSIHSFTAQMQGQSPRPWHAGFLTRTDATTGNALLASIQMQKPKLILALNQPYIIEDESDWFIPQYAESNKLNHCLIEVRNDQLLDSNGVDSWASLLATAIESVMENVA